MAKSHSWKRWIGGLAVLLGAPALYCAVAEPPDEVPYPTPLASGDHEALTHDWWRIFHAQDAGAVSRVACGELAHGPIPEAPAQAARSRSLPPVAAPPPSGELASDDLLCRLEEAVAQAPNDPLLPTILGAAYSWRAQMRIDPEQTEYDLHEARLHSGQGVANGNPMAGGFQAAPTWILGFLTDNDRYKKSGYDQMVSDTLEFAAFHGYIEGALMAAMLDPENPHPDYDYEWALVSFQENLETCLFGSAMRGKLKLPWRLKMNRFLFNTVAVLSAVTGRGFCYNNSTSPFNMEGLYVAQGDAFLKQGDFDLARVAYENALVSPNIENWPFKEQVEIRLADMEGVRKKFLADSGKMKISDEPTAMVVQASWYCASCHQQAHAPDQAPWETSR